jgi:hypothetical protein
MVSEIGAGPDARGEDWVDTLLRTDRNRYIDDGGFTARVMGALPALAPAWRKPAVAGLWGLAVVGAAFALPDTAHDILRGAYTLYAAQPLTLPMLLTMIAGVGAALWTAAAYTTLRVR